MSEGSANVGCVVCGQETRQLPYCIECDATGRAAVHQNSIQAQRSEASYAAVAKSIRAVADRSASFSRREVDRLRETATLLETADHVGAAYASGARTDHETPIAPDDQRPGQAVPTHNDDLERAWRWMLTVSEGCTQEDVVRFMNEVREETTRNMPAAKTLHDAKIESTPEARTRVADAVREVMQRPTQATVDPADRMSLELPMFPNDHIDEQGITCIFCRSTLPCEYALRVKRDGEQAHVGIHEKCVEPLRRKNPCPTKPVVEPAQSIGDVAMAQRWLSDRCMGGQTVVRGASDVHSLAELLASVRADEAQKHLRRCPDYARNPALEAAIWRVVKGTFDHLEKESCCPFCDLGHDIDEEGMPETHAIECPLRGFERWTDVEALLSYLAQRVEPGDFSAANPRSEAAK